RARGVQGRLWPGARFEHLSRDRAALRGRYAGCAVAHPGRIPQDPAAAETRRAAALLTSGFSRALLSASHGHSPLFDHPVRTYQDRLRNLDAERLGGLEID